MGFEPQTLEYGSWSHLWSVGLFVVLDFLGSIEVINHEPYLQFVVPSTCHGWPPSVALGTFEIFYLDFFLIWGVTFSTPWEHVSTNEI